MPPPRRPRRRSAAAVDSPRARNSGRLSARHAEPFKREGRCGGGGAADDGLPLSDEALLLVFSALSGSTADLVRCAATCRRWRRLVSSDAAFICRGGAPPRTDPFIRGLALGFFHFRTDAHAGSGVGPTAAPRFVPLSPAAAARHRPAIAAVAGDASRVVASRNGHLVLDLLRRANARTTHAVRLGVCNPFTAGGGGGVDVLPPLRGKDSPTGPYACTVITAVDEVDGHNRGGSGDSASYRVVLLYNRRSFTALRCYFSDTGTWGPETEVTGARIGRTQLAGGLHAAVVHRGVVFWPRLAVALPLASLRHPIAVTVTKNGKPPRYTVAGLSSERDRTRNAERLLGVMPDGRMLRVEADGETIRAYHGSDNVASGRDICRCPHGGALVWKWTAKLSLMRLHSVRLRWLGEKSGVVVFTAGNCDGPGTHVYTLDVETMDVRMVATGGESSVGDVCGYEMDRVTLLASLGRKKMGKKRRLAKDLRVSMSQATCTMSCCGMNPEPQPLAQWTPMSRYPSNRTLGTHSCSSTSSRSEFSVIPNDASRKEQQVEKLE